MTGGVLAALLTGAAAATPSPPVSPPPSPGVAPSGSTEGTSWLSPASMDPALGPGLWVASAVLKRPGEVGRMGPTGPQGPPGPAGPTDLDILGEGSRRTGGDNPYGILKYMYVWPTPAGNSIAFGSEVSEEIEVNGRCVRDLWHETWTCFENIMGPAVLPLSFSRMGEKVELSWAHTPSGGKDAILAVFGDSTEVLYVRSTSPILSENSDSSKWFIALLIAVYLAGINLGFYIKHCIDKRRAMGAAEKDEDEAKGTDCENTVFEESAVQSNADQNCSPASTDTLQEAPRAN